MTILEAAGSGEPPDGLSPPEARFFPQGTARRSRGFGTMDGAAPVDIIGKRVRLICGEAWTGKSTVARGLAQWLRAPFVELRRCVGGSAILPARNGTVVLDGLDEALQREPTFDTRLVGELADAPSVQAILTCRSIELPSTFVGDLASALKVPRAEIRMDLAPWSEAVARAAVEAQFPESFDAVIEFARRRSLESLLQFPRAVLALAEIYSRGDLNRIADEPAAWRAVLEQLFEERNDANVASDITPRARLDAISKVAALMSMTGHAEVKLHEAVSRGGVYLAQLVDGPEVRAARQALGAVGLERAPGIWTIEPANIRDWLVAFGLRDVTNANLIAALTPLQGHALGVFKAVTRLRPDLLRQISMLDRIETELHNASEHGIVLGDALLEEAPAAIGEELARRIADERRPAALRASLLSMTSERHAPMVTPVALSLVRRAIVDEDIRHEALRLVLHFGRDDDVRVLIDDIPAGLDGADNGWLLYEAVKRQLRDPVSILWEIPVAGEVIDHRRLLAHAVADALRREDVLPLLQAIAAKGRWPASQIVDRALELLNEGPEVRVEEAVALVGVYLRVGRDEEFHLDQVIHRANLAVDTRRAIFRTWLQHEGVPRHWAVLLSEDLRWFLSQSIDGPRSTEAWRVALGRSDGQQFKELAAVAEASRPGIVEEFHERRRKQEEDERKWLSELRELDVAKKRREGRPRRRLSDAVQAVLDRPDDAAEKLHDLVWISLPTNFRSRGVVGEIGELPPEMRLRLFDTLIDGLAGVAPTPPPGRTATEIPTRYLLEQELLSWLLTADGVAQERWLTATTVRKFLPGLLRRSFNNAHRVIVAMFAAYPVDAAAVAIDEIHGDFQAASVETSARNAPASAWENSHLQRVVEDLLVAPPYGPPHRALLRVLRSTIPGIAANVATTWLDSGAGGETQRAAMDALFISDARVAIARLAVWSATDRRAFLSGSSVVDDVTNRSVALSDLPSRELALLFAWLEEIVPGAERVRSGFVDTTGRLQMWKSAVLNLLWTRFQDGDALAETLLDELSHRFAWLQQPLLRDRTKRALKAAVSGAPQETGRNV